MVLFKIVLKTIFKLIDVEEIKIISLSLLLILIFVVNFKLVRIELSKPNGNENHKREIEGKLFWELSWFIFLFYQIIQLEFLVLNKTF